jgi:hypothetical protein
MRWAFMVLRIRAYTVFLDGKLERRRPLGRCKRSWEDNIEMDLHDVGWERQCAMNLRFPKMCGIYGLAGELIFSRRTLLLGVG